MVGRAARPTPGAVDGAPRHADRLPEVMPAFGPGDDPDRFEKRAQQPREDKWRPARTDSDARTDLVADDEISMRASSSKHPACLPHDGGGHDDDSSAR